MPTAKLYRRGDIEHMPKQDLVDLVLGQWELWPQDEPWDVDPLGRRARPTTRTLKRVIIEQRFVRHEAQEDVDVDTSIAPTATSEPVLEAPDSALPAPDVLSEDEPTVTTPNLPPPPPNESPIAAAIRTATEADPDLAQPFGQFLRSKNRRIDDYETVQMCRFALNFEGRWYLQRVMVHGVLTIVRKANVLEVLRHSPSWFTQAKQIVELVRLMTEEDLDRLKASHLGGRNLIPLLQDLTGKH